MIITHQSQHGIVFSGRGLSPKAKRNAEQGLLRFIRTEKKQRFSHYVATPSSETLQIRQQEEAIDRKIVELAQKAIERAKLKREQAINKELQRVKREKEYLADSIAQKTREKRAKGLSELEKVKAKQESRKQTIIDGNKKLRYPHKGFPMYHELFQALEKELRDKQVLVEIQPSYKEAKDKPHRDRVMIFKLEQGKLKEKILDFNFRELRTVQRTVATIMAEL